MNTTKRALVARDKAARTALFAMVVSNLLAAAGPTLVALLDARTTPIEYLVLAAFAVVALVVGPFNEGLDSSLAATVCLSCLTVAAGVAIPWAYPTSDPVRHAATGYAVAQAAVLCFAGAFATRSYLRSGPDHDGP